MVLGLSNPKFICDGVTVDLPNTILNPTYLDSAEIMQQSIINGERTWSIKHDYANFVITVYLLKYPDPSAKLNELLTYKNKLVTFYPFADADPVKDLTGQPALFYLASVQPFYVNSDERYDAATVNFISSKYVQYLTQPAQGYGFNYGRFYGIGL